MKDFRDIREHRDALGLTLEQLAIKCHSRMSAQFINMVEKAWNEIRNKKLLKGYQHSKIFISKKDNRKKIKFSKQKNLEDLYKIYKEKQINS